MKQIAHAYYFWVMNNATSGNLWSCQDLFRQAIKVKNESMHKSHHPILHVITPPTNTDTRVGLRLNINADLFPFVSLPPPFITHPTPTCQIFFLSLKGSSDTMNCIHLKPTYTVASLLFAPKEISFPLPWPKHLEQAWILQNNWIRKGAPVRKSRWKWLIFTQNQTYSKYWVLGTEALSLPPKGSQFPRP